MQEPLLVATTLWKRFCYPKPRDLLKGIDITVYKGERVALVGPSGSGKSTLLSILATLDPPSSGEIIFLGKPIKKWDLSFLRNQVFGFVFQQYHLLEEYSVLENILMPAYISRQSITRKSKAYLFAIGLLERIGMLAQKDFPVKQLSGGEQQRIAIARALCNNPSLIFADEPSGNLDKKNAVIIYELLFSFCASMNKAMIVVTHDKELAAMCDRTLYLESGKLSLAKSHEVIGV